MTTQEAFEYVDYAHNDRLRLAPQTRNRASDNLVLSVSHRTIGDARSVLLDRDQASQLYAWLAEWLRPR